MQTIRRATIYFMLELHQVAVLAVALLDIILCYRQQTLYSKIFYCKRAHDVSVYHGLFHGSKVRSALVGKMPQKSAGKRVAGTSWVDYFVKEKCGRGKYQTFVCEKDSAMFALFDYHEF